VVRLLCDVRGARWLELEVRTRWRVLFLILHSFLRRPHTDRYPDDILKKLRRNGNRDSCEKNATGTKNTGIRRIPAGICNLGGVHGIVTENQDWVNKQAKRVALGALQHCNLQHLKL
jgi:hypothetical protein